MKKYFLMILSLFLVSCSNTTDTTEKTYELVYDLDVSKNTFPKEMQIAKDLGYINIIEIKTNSNDIFNSSNSIRIISVEDECNNEKIRRAASIMISLLTDLPKNNEKSIIGNSKKEILETMIKRNATLMINKTEDSGMEMSLKLYTSLAIKLNIISNILEKATLTSDFADVDISDYEDILNKLEELDDEDKNELYQEKLIESIAFNKNTPLWLKNSQDLYFEETSLEGDCGYLTNFDTSCVNAKSSSDGSLEEILHIIQAQGISPSKTGGPLQKRIQDYALELYENVNNIALIWNPGKESWEDDWAGDDINPELGTTYSHEYYAAAVESYYGLWQYRGEGGYGGELGFGMDKYTSINREQLKIKDPKGDSFVKEFVPSYHQYTARIQSSGVKAYYNNKGKTPIFKMSLSSNKDEKYTYKSRYLLNAKILGDAAINLLGNDQNNKLEGNTSDNIIDGADGSDTYIINGESSSYDISQNSDKSYNVQGPNIGNDTLHNIEFLQFLDKVVELK